jgi:transcriptional regulator with XRE-family HTH domain
MQEFFRTGRTIHRAAIIAAAALFLFSLSPDPRSQYASARQTLVDLKRLNLNSYKKWVRRQLADRNQKVTGTEFWNRLKPELNAKIPGKVQLVGSASVNSNAVLFDQMLFIGLSTSNGAIEPDKQSVQEIAKAIRLNADIDYFIVPYEEIASRASDALTKYNEKPSDRISVEKLDIAFPDAFFAGTMRIELSHEGESNTENIEFIPEWDTDTLEDKSFFDWYNTHAAYNIYAPSPDRILFKNLEPFWPSIRHRTLDEAIGWVNNEMRQASRDRTLSLFGFEVSARQVTIFGPLLLFSLLFMLAAHLRYTRTVLSKTRHDDDPRFPWLTIMPSWINDIVRGTTLLIVPIGATTFLLWRVWGSLDELRFCLFLLPVATAIWSYAEASKFARSLATSQDERSASDGAEGK